MFYMTRMRISDYVHLSSEYVRFLLIQFTTLVSYLSFSEVTQENYNWI